MSAAPGEVDWYRLGVHPDVVEHIWKSLPRATGATGWMVEGAVVAVLGGRVVALGIGTTYAVRLPQPALREADGLDYSPAHRWGAAGHVTDLDDELGPGWRFGRWQLEREAEWIKGWSAGPARAAP